MSKIGSSAPSLKQFMLQRETLKLYRNILRVIKKVPNEDDRQYLRNWARSDFRANKNVTDTFAIKSLQNHAEKSLRELRKNLNLTN